MPPKLVLIRHAQALHNVAKEYDIPDPELSSQGIRECAQLKTHLKETEPLGDQIELIVASPMRRTLQTALLTCDWLIERGVKVVPDALWQETSDKPCDTGTALPILGFLFPSIDMNEVDQLFPAKDGEFAFRKDAVLARGRKALKALYNRPERVVAVVSHAGFLRVGVAQRHFGNADYRIFEFTADGEGLQESLETEKRGGGMGWSWPGVAGITEGDFPEDSRMDRVPVSNGNL